MISLLTSEEEQIIKDQVIERITEEVNYYYKVLRSRSDFEVLKNFLDYFLTILPKHITKFSKLCSPSIFVSIPIVQNYKIIFFTTY